MAPLEEIAEFADVPLPVDLEIARPVMKLGDLISLREGRILALARSAGENIDIRVGGVLIGYGEVIVSEGGVGVRITDFKGE
jgi:flagellar motor switch protein FliN/FliY